MGVFDRFNSEKKGTDVEVSPEVYETQDFGEGIVSGKLSENRQRRQGLDANIVTLRQCR